MIVCWGLCNVKQMPDGKERERERGWDIKGKTQRDTRETQRDKETQRDTTENKRKQETKRKQEKTRDTKRKQQQSKLLNQVLIYFVDFHFKFY